MDYTHEHARSFDTVRDERFRYLSAEPDAEPVVGEWRLEHGTQHTMHQYATRTVPSKQSPGSLTAERELTGKVCFVCNCGEASGWVDKHTLPLPSDWLIAHMPAADRARWLSEQESSSE